MDETAEAVTDELSFEIKAKGDEPPRPRRVTVSLPDEPGIVAVTALWSLTTAPVVGLKATVAVPDPTANVASTLPLASKVGGAVTPLIVYDGEPLPRTATDAVAPSVVIVDPFVEFRLIVAAVTDGF